MIPVQIVQQKLCRKMWRHIVVVLNSYFYCNLCNKGFVTESRLKPHSEQHIEATLYQATLYQATLYQCCQVLTLMKKNFKTLTDSRIW